MAEVGGQLAGLLEPIRDLVVGRLLQEIGRALERGRRVQHEPVIRNGDGRILRDGGLHLPRRADLALTDEGGTTVRNVDSPEAVAFPPVILDAFEGCTAVIGPFRWDAVRLTAEIEGGSLDPAPIRRWFLEAFQSRYGELAPDLDGAVHALMGPHPLGDDAYEFRVDLGSAPVETFAEMLEAFARSGATRLSIGNGQPIAEVAERG